MITASEWNAYNAGVAAISDSVEREVIEGILAWHVENPDATVAESREYAKLLMDSKVRSYDSLASSFAAEWYDYQAERGGARLDQAITASVYVPKNVDEVARYQAKKLVKGDFEGFAKACGEYARNDSLRSLNQTILANAKRDGRKGVRFARVASGRNTCSFCLGLCSRGAVYYSRKTAGEFSKFHRWCSCKVVPGFEDDPMAVLVEGHDPSDALRQWQRLQNGDVVATGLYAKGGKAVSDSASLIDSEIKAMHQSFNKTDRSAESWSRTVGKFIESFSASGRVVTELWTNPEGKELQVAGWLAMHGVDCVFRNPDVHKRLDGNTSDLLIDGETWDIKRITSSNPKKIATAIFSKEVQGPNFIIDLSCSSMTRNTAVGKIASILEDPSVSKVMLIMEGTATIFKK